MISKSRFIRFISIYIQIFSKPFSTDIDIKAGGKTVVKQDLNTDMQNLTISTYQYHDTAPTQNGVT